MKDVIFGWIYGRFDILTVIWRDPKTGSPWYCMLLLRIHPWHWETLLVSLHLQHVRVRPHRHSHRPAPSGRPNWHTAWASIWPLWGDYSHTLFSPLHHLPAGWLHNGINLAWEVKTDTAVVVWGGWWWWWWCDGQWGVEKRPRPIYSVQWLNVRWRWSGNLGPELQLRGLKRLTWDEGMWGDVSICRLKPILLNVCTHTRWHGLLPQC